MEKKPEAWLFLGASRGLGRAFLEKALNEKPDLLKAHVFARKIESLPNSVAAFEADFSKEESWEKLILQIRQLQPARIFFFAAGGPYGLYQDKAWKDHRWALKVSFEFPAFLLHQFLKEPQSLQQFVVVGSSVAESKPDPMASSYCAAKHALVGLITSVQQEQATPFDLRLFSPGYLDTNLLPAHAWPRQQAGLVQSPSKVAEMLWASIHNADDANEHFVLKSSP